MLKDIHQNDAAKVINLTKETHEIASRMSASLKRRDLERVRYDVLVSLIRFVVRYGRKRCLP